MRCATCATCATCAGEASQGRLLCEQCRGYAQELEDLRLRLPVRMRTSGVAIALALAVVTCTGPARTPCDAHDHEAQLDLATELADCMSRIDACTTQACIDPIEAECNAYADKRCAEAVK